MNYPEMKSSDEILNWMGLKFVRLRETHSKKAWSFYRDALMYYQAALREVIPVETIIQRAMAIEEFVKGMRDSEKIELTPEQVLEGTRQMLSLRTSEDGESERDKTPTKT